MTCKNQPEALRLAAKLEDTKSARLPTWQDMLGDAEQLVRQKPTFSKYIRGTVLENDVPVWIADFAQRLLLRELTRFALRAHAAALEEAAQDEALLRQALDRLEAVVERFDPYIRDNECRPMENARSTIAALRERLGDEKG